MNTYIVYVKHPSDSMVYDKRFDAVDYEDLQAKVVSYFKYCDNGHEIVRVEEVKTLLGDIKLHFGPNMIKAVA